jgi:hypothetical protein
MSTHKESEMEQWFKRNCSWVVPRKRPPKSTTQHQDAPNAASDVPSTSSTVSRGSRPLPATPAQGTSRVDLQSNGIMNQPSTAPAPGIGEHIGHASCIVLAFNN